MGAFAAVVLAAFAGDTPADAAPLRKELEAEYAKQVRATKEGNPELFLSTLAPDYRLKLLDGRTLDRRQTEALLRRHMELTRAVRHYSLTVQALELRGGEAVATVLQRFARSQLGPDDMPHEVESSVTHRETWARTPAGWRLRLVEELEQGPVIVDGKPGR